MQTTKPTGGLQENIHEDEQIEWVVEPSRAARFVDQGLGAIIGALVVSVAVGPGVYTGVASVASHAVALLAGATAVAVLVGVLLRGHLLRLLRGTHAYAATDTRLLKYDSTFGQSMTSVPLDGIQDAEYSISSTEDFFDVGTVTVDTGRGYETMALPYTPTPTDVAREISDLAARARQSDASNLGTSEGYTPSEDLSTEQPADGLKENLFPDEQLQWVTTPNAALTFYWNLSGKVTTPILFAVFLTGLVVPGIAIATGYPMVAPVSIVVAIGIVAVFVLAIRTIGQYVTTTQYAATDRRLLEYDGQFGKRLDSVPLAGIQDAEYDVSTFENVMGVGTVTIDTGKGYERMRLRFVEKPAVVAREISQLAASDIAKRDAVDPDEVSVGDDIETNRPSEELSRNIANEELSWVIRPDKKSRLLAGLASQAPRMLYFGPIVAVVAAGTTFSSTNDPVTTVAAGALGFVFGVALGAVNGIGYLFETVEYALSDERLLEYRGTFGRELSSVPLEGIQDAEFNMGFVESRLSVGNVTVDTGQGHERMALFAVSNPAAVAREISEAANAYRVASEADQGTPNEGTTREHGQSVCPDCEVAIDATASYCPECGAEQPQRA